MERVQKILSQCGVASRRQAETMMIAGRVEVNGKKATLGDKIDLERDRVTIDGKLLTFQHRPQSLYILINKPRGVVCTCDDPQNRHTVLDLLPPKMRKGQGLHPVGRLDINSTGALLLTNDGELTLKLTHPRYHLPKTYKVWVKNSPSESVLQTWRNGVILDHQKTLPAHIKVLKRQRQRTLLEVVLVEGKNRQIRRIAQKLGYPVLALHRSAIGEIKLDREDQLLGKTGNYRYLSPREIHYLKHECLSR
ncbi:MAG: pseudouridine synthase [Halothece sp.]